jgi:ferredoxin/mono/diheme cytochrome c family protein
MILLGASLVVISIVLPVGMLGRADPAVVADRIPLDPFVLFLLPILEAEWRWIGVAVLAALTVLGLLIPFLARGGERPPARILTDACTGCNLCVVDCPYQALSLVAETADDSTLEVGGQGEQGEGQSRKVAFVDEAACTSCGICLGSCAFDAIKVPGISLVPITAVATGPADLDSPAVVSVVCDRHLVDGTLGGGGDHGSIMAVRCAGVVGVDLVKGLRDAGASEVHIVGCARNDCRYGVGNTLASERIAGIRAPHLPRAARSSVSEEWAGVHDLEHSEISLDEASEVMGSENRRSLVAAGAVVAASAVAIAAATFTPFGQRSDEAAVRVVVDQEPGRPLLGADDFTVAVDQVVLAVDGEQQAPAAVSESGGDRVGVHQWSVPVGRHRLVLTVRGTRTESGGANEGIENIEAVVFDETVELQPNQRLQLPVVAQPLEGDATMGRQLFESRITGCSICHSVQAGDDRVGPSLYGIGSRASTRVEGLDAETYLWQSILLPDEYVVEGYPAGQMLPIYRDRLSQEELDAIIDYLLTLTEEQSDPQSGQDGAPQSEDGS